MRVIFDIVHPAHVHFFKHMIRDLRQRGHATTVLAREKDVTTRLLDNLDIEYVTTGRAGPKGRLGQVAELVGRDLSLARLSRRFRADVIVTRNPAGVQAARLSGAVGIFDTDDGSAAGIHFTAARPFAHFLTSPDCLPEHWGRRHLRYRGYKQSAYLHRDLFVPNRSVLDDLGISAHERYFVVRFVAMHASHDGGEFGMSESEKDALLRLLLTHGRVLLSCEGAIPVEWQHLRFTLPPERIHDVLAFADLFVGDSQTMAAEAAILGTPALRCSTFSGRLSYLEELENRYGLTWGFHPRDATAFRSKLDSLLAERDLRASVAPGHERMHADKINVARWYVDLIEQVGSRR